jgi:hypothetical protein
LKECSCEIDPCRLLTVLNWTDLTSLVINGGGKSGQFVDGTAAVVAGWASSAGLEQPATAMSASGW